MFALFGDYPPLPSPHATPTPTDAVNGAVVTATHPYTGPATDVPVLKTGATVRPRSFPLPPPPTLPHLRLLPLCLQHPHPLARWSRGSRFEHAGIHEAHGTLLSPCCPISRPRLPMGTPPSSAHTFPMFCQVLPAGLHVLECTLFVGAAAPVRLDFRVDYRLEGTQFPDLNTRQVLGAGAVVAKPGATR